MEHDIILSDEVYKLGILALPPLLPALRKQLLGVRDISDRGIEPHIKNLSVRAFNRYRHTPVKVTAHRTWLETAVDPALALSVDIAPPLLVSVEDPLRKPFLILVEREIPVLGLLLHELAAAEGRLRVDEFVRTEGGATLLALVAVSAFSAASRTCTGDVAVCKEGLGLLVVVLLAHLLDELALIIELAEIVCRILVMGLRRSP